MSRQEALLEVCIDSIGSAINAIMAGVGRLEVCSALSEGGLTPSNGLLQAIRCYLEQNDGKFTVQLFVMIRPRPGDFCYNQLEIDQMLSEIHALQPLADGFVFGCLTPNGQLDQDGAAQLLQACELKPATFHRAFDVAADPIALIEQLIVLGFRRILTSGQAATAEQGLEQLRSYIALAGDRIVIMPGGGINDSNIERIVSELSLPEYHSSASSRQSSRMQHVNSVLYSNISCLDNTYDYKQCDLGKAISIVKRLKSSYLPNQFN